MGFLELSTTYRCWVCGGHGCKLWRPTDSGENLLCLDCLCKKEKIGKNEINEKGQWYHNDQFMYCVKQHIPAVPLDEINFYTYGSVPSEMAEWWRNLLNFPIFYDKKFVKTHLLNHYFLGLDV